MPRWPRVRLEPSGYPEASQHPSGAGVLCARWMLRLALETGQGWDNLFSEDKVRGFLGLPRVTHDHDLDDHPVPRAKLRADLEKKLAHYEALAVSRDTPIFVNIRHLAKKLEISGVESDLLLWRVLAEAVLPMKEYIECLDREREYTIEECARLLAVMLGSSSKEIKKAMSREAALWQVGFLEFKKHRFRGLLDKMELREDLPDLLLLEHEDPEKGIFSHFYQPAPEAAWTLLDFPHVEENFSFLRHYLAEAFRQGTPGVNILIHGIPGTGKTEFVRSLAKELGARLFEVAHEDEDREAASKRERFSSFRLAQRLFAKEKGALILFDEADEALLPAGNSFFLSFFGMEGLRRSEEKSWINRVLEENPVPTFWVLNSHAGIDPAYLRRFDYGFAFPETPREVRLGMVRRHLDPLGASQAFMDRLAAHEGLTAAQMGKIAKTMKLLAKLPQEDLEAHAWRQLTHSAQLLDQKLPPVTTPATHFSLEFIHSDADALALIEGLRRLPSSRLCFYGPPGTGKSELARYIAETLDKPFFHKRASDILSPFVGVTEMRIAQMFAQARDREAILCLDEADSFLADRKGAFQGWEVTQVNELLTQMESFEGIFICTTNLWERLDLASLRRFDFKVRFRFLTLTQKKMLFVQELKRLGGCLESWEAHLEAEMARMASLTPGDFAAVARRFRVLGQVPSPREFANALAAECTAKGESPGSLGFLS